MTRSAGVVGALLCRAVLRTVLWVCGGWLPAIAGVATGDGGAAAEQAAFFTDRTRGWFWYEVPPETLPLIPSPQVADPAAETDPRRVLEVVREGLQVSLARALLEPTPDNLRDYLQRNERALHRAAQFAGAWQRLLWSEPALDHRLRAPASDAAVAARNWAQAVAEDAALAKLARRRGLWFFFRSDCPVCHRFAPVLREFSGRYGFQVLAVSLDGGTLPGFRGALRDRGTALRLGVSAVPAVFLVNPRARRAQAVGYGYLSASELARRVRTLGAEEVTPAPVETALERSP